MSGIELKELPVTSVERIECYHHGGRVILVLDGRAYSLSADAAIELAFRLCGDEARR